MALEESSLIRQWAILCDLDDDLNDPTTILEIWEQREDIDRLLESLVRIGIAEAYRLEERLRTLR